VDAIVEIPGLIHERDEPAECDDGDDHPGDCGLPLCPLRPGLDMVRRILQLLIELDHKRHCRAVDSDVHVAHLRAKAKILSV
jgi:hypothetical protein